MARILYTSLSEIKSFNPCVNSWKNILKGQGKTKEDAVLFPLVDCLKSNSISDVCWLLGKRKTEIDICVKFARKCADSVAHLKNNYTASAADYAASAADDVSNASDAASACAAYASAYADYADYEKQEALNKQFLIECIQEYENNNNNI